MSIINLTNQQLKILHKNCEKMNVEPIFNADRKFGEELFELQNICKYLIDGLNDLSDAAMDLEWSARDKKHSEAVDGIDKVVSLATEIFEDTDNLSETLQNMLAAYRNLTQCSDYQLILEETEIAKLIQENFTDDTTLSVCYKDGKFALAFCEIIDDEEISEPFLMKVFAEGEAYAYDNLRKYIGTFLNLDTEE